MARVYLQEYCTEARHLIESCAYDEAIAICRHILKRYPKHAETYRILGEACLEKGELDEAADIFRRLLSADPENFVAYAGLGVICEEKQQLADAIWHIERAFELAPNNEEIRNTLRRLYGQRDGTEPARIKLNKVALARLYSKGGQYRQAIDEFRRCLELEPTRMDIKLSLAETLWRDGRREQAAEMATEILQTSPDSLKAILLLGVIQIEKGRIEEGQGTLALARPLDPENTFAQALFGEHSPLKPAAVKVPRLESSSLWPAPIVPAETAAKPTFPPSQVEMPEEPSDECTTTLAMGEQILETPIADQVSPAPETVTEVPWEEPAAPPAVSEAPETIDAEVADETLVLDSEPVVAAEFEVEPLELASALASAESTVTAEGAVFPVQGAIAETDAAATKSTTASTLECPATESPVFPVQAAVEEALAAKSVEDEIVVPTSNVAGGEEPAASVADEAEPVEETPETVVSDIETTTVPDSPKDLAVATETTFVAVPEQVVSTAPVKVPEAMVAPVTGECAEAVPAIEPQPVIIAAEAMAAPVEAELVAARPEEESLPNPVQAATLQESPVATLSETAHAAETTCMMLKGAAQEDRASAPAELAELGGEVASTEFHGGMEPVVLAAHEPMGITAVPMQSSEAGPTISTEHLLERLKQNPKDDMARLSLARTYRDQEQVESALDQYSMLARSKAVVLSEVIQDMEGVVASRPSNLAAHELLADLYAKNGQLQKALERYRWLLGQVELK